MNKNLKEQIKELEKSHLNLEVRKSSEELDKILADDFFEIGSSGRMIFKEECITSGVDLDEMELFEFELHPLGPDVVLTTYFIHNKTKKRNTLRSSIWKQRDGRWQLYFHQGTVTKSLIPG
ncbi:hypothetical protein SAMN05421743_101194 [Thalassobacillus cyri]|uniref:DUF4440 domain-containing protein n=1 Tax=Thalassobacillus cyri TaxID=571932 RepID=A0A1H3VWK6_9BACI|nr:DUF4440 domain-containing protein [Thalassobacillus cyri]SDZ78594.1 hypothetical protein SAMN05421743_101194 [Thalassobacillus cyri]